MIGEIEMVDILKQVNECGILTAIYTNKNDYDKFSVGYILSVAEDSFLTKHLSTRGEFDGYSVRKVDDVYRVETNGLYLHKIEQLYKQKINQVEIPAIDTNGNLLLNAITYAINNNFITIICIDESANDIVGYIESFDNYNIKVLQISEYGQKNGETIFSVDEIIKICINDTDCVDLDILYRNNGI